MIVMRFGRSLSTAMILMAGPGLLGGTGAMAQPAPPAPAFLPDGGNSALPDDMPPPPLAAMLRPPRPESQRPLEPPVEPVDAPSASVALVAAQAALAQCAKDQHKVGVAVSDAGGHLMVGLMMEGARPGRIYSGARKNAAAVLFGQPTSQVQARMQRGDPAALAMLKPWMVVFPGAVPLMSGGKVVGAIGVSGATAQQDEACAAAGAAAVEGRL